MHKTIARAKQLAAQHNEDYVVICEAGKWFTVSYNFWVGSTYPDYSKRVTPWGAIYTDREV